MTHIFRAIFISGLTITFCACRSDGERIDEPSAGKTFHVRKMSYPLWVRNTSVLEVDLRQIATEDAFAALGSQLPRIKKMGITTISLLPVFPISISVNESLEKNIWPIADFTKVNPDLGTFEDFRDLVSQIHRMNMHVILHWVSNHTGLDHAWIDSHPEWYTNVTETNKKNEPDEQQLLAKLDYEVGPLRNTMIESMKFWLRAGDIDGFICDDAV